MNLKTAIRKDFQKGVGSRECHFGAPTTPFFENPLKYIYLQVRYFTIKLIVSSCFVVLFCRYNEDLKLIAIISSLAVFIVCHFIEGFIVQKKIINNVEK